MGNMKRHVLAPWMALVVSLILSLPVDAAPVCDPTAPPASCNNGACLGTRVCDYPGSYCQYSQKSNATCSVCGRTGTRSCTENGDLIPGSCSAYAAEVCNNCDDDGDGALDEGLTSGACDPQGNGCSGTTTCVAGGWQCLIPPNKTVDCSTQCGAPAHRQCNPDGSLGVCVRDVATPETCNGCDDDRDGAADNLPGQGRDTLVSTCEGGSGECQGSSKRCVAGAWSACIAPAEVCNGMDDDCDNLFDEGGVCRTDATTCQCQPLTCEQLGVNCGSAADGCGGTINCGTCPGGME